MDDGLIKGEIAKMKGRKLAQLEFERFTDPLTQQYEFKDLAETQAPGYEDFYVLAYKAEREVLSKIWNRAFDRGYDKGREHYKDW